MSYGLCVVSPKLIAQIGGRMCAEKMDPKFTMNILAVDDEENVRNLYSTVLGEEGYRVVTASNGAEAIEKFEGEKFDLVILDLKLPDMYGTEVLKRIREKAEELAVIIVTGYPSLESSIDAIKAGIYDYIVKPLSLRDLRMVLQRVFEKIILIRENKKLLEELRQKNKELRERISQLEMFTRAATDREERMADLKEKIKELEEKLKVKENT